MVEVGHASSMPAARSASRCSRSACSSTQGGRKLIRAGTLAGRKGRTGPRPKGGRKVRAASPAARRRPGAEPAGDPIPSPSAVSSTSAQRSALTSGVSAPDLVAVGSISASEPEGHDAAVWRNEPTSPPLCSPRPERGRRAVRPPQRNRDSAPSTRGSRSRIAGVRTEIASLETRPQRRGLRGHRAVPPTKVAHRPRGVRSPLDPGDSRAREVADVQQELLNAPEHRPHLLGHPLAVALLWCRGRRSASMRRRWKRTRRCGASSGGIPGNRTRRSCVSWRRHRGLRRRRERSWRGLTGPGRTGRRRTRSGSLRRTRTRRSQR